MAKAKKQKGAAAKFAAVREYLKSVLVDRGAEVDGALTALLAREHVLLLGPPGTAKTYLVEQLTKLLGGASYFYWLMTRFSVPEELFGTFSYTKIKQDVFERKTDGKLPDASVAFLDEIFKANSSILNSLLTLINERKFHNGTSAIDCPLQMMVGASNELPESKELDALYDRFLLRFWVDYVGSRDSMRTLLTSTTQKAPAALTMQELETLQAEAEAVSFPDEMIDLLLDVKDAVEHAGFACSDRRWKKALTIIKAHAKLHGRDEVTERDLAVLADVLWQDPKDRHELRRVIYRVSNPIVYEAQTIADSIEADFDALRIDFDADRIGDHERTEMTNAFMGFRNAAEAATEKLEKLAKRDAEKLELIAPHVEAFAEMAGRAGRALCKLTNLPTDF